MPKQHVVTLTAAERQHLEDLTRKGVAPARAIRRARSLLLAAEGRPDAEIARAVGCCVATVENLRRRWSRAGLAALADQPRPGAARKLDGRAEAFLVATACSAPPAGRAVWTMQLLADQLVTAGIVADISDETVRRTLKKTSSNPGSAGIGACPR
jgi:transposase